ncbi:MAG TPA: LytTR family DNA-binding domain-containing protein [Puia sp.]|jgi:DNA-binding LytR/AlgR family response regulator|nr:LytTR family DNA-binding domain-containing protein [Puia sp.]
MNIPCIIVDDEPLAREGLERLVLEAGFLDLVALCSNAMEANRILTTERIELMFLDIQMPRLRGTDFLRSLEIKPKVIITSAHADFAIEGFELNVLDYLLKPITPDRFLKAVNRAREVLSQEGAYFFVRSGKGFEKIVFDELLFIEAAQNYCALHTTRGKFLTLSTIHALEEQLPPDRFLRIQKSYIVSIGKIQSVSSLEVTIGAHTIPVSNSYREALLALVDKKLLRK